jgi:hypothetical protein
MAYTIIRSDGTTLTTIQDGTIDTTSTALGLPGRNYAGYGQVLDTNFVHLLENFAGANVPSNPLKGQLWFNSNDGTLRVCPADGTTDPGSWLVVTTTNAYSDTNFGNIIVSGNITGNNIRSLNAFNGDTITVRIATVTESLVANAANITTNAVIGAVETAIISTGAVGTPGTLTGTWTVNNTIQIANTAGGTSNVRLTPSGVFAPNYYYANGQPYNPSNYSDSNVYVYLNGNSTGYSAGQRFNGNITATSVTTSLLTGGGSISGIWGLTPGSRLTATYADLAERFESDAIYEPGTVVELGGEKEITAVVDDLSDNVFGVISNTAAYLMNSGAGTDETHPAVAVSGRVKVKVKGTIKKGDRLVSAGNGFARAAAKGEANAFNSIGRALADKLSTEEGTVEAIVIIH